MQELAFFGTKILRTPAVRRDNEIILRDPGGRMQRIETLKMFWVTQISFSIFYFCFHSCGLWLCCSQVIFFFFGSRVRLGVRGEEEVGEAKKLERGTWDSTGATIGMKNTIKEKMIGFSKNKIYLGLCLALWVYVCVCVCLHWNRE